MNAREIIDALPVCEARDGEMALIERLVACSPPSGARERSAARFSRRCSLLVALGIAITPRWATSQANASWAGVASRWLASLRKAAWRASLPRSIGE